MIDIRPNLLDKNSSLDEIRTESKKAAIKEQVEKEIKELSFE